MWDADAEKVSDAEKMRKRCQEPINERSRFLLSNEQKEQHTGSGLRPGSQDFDRSASLCVRELIDVKSSISEQHH
jgi:hypothetical protein